MTTKLKTKSKINRFIITVVLLFAGTASITGCSSNIQKESEGVQKEETVKDEDVSKESNKGEDSKPEEADQTKETENTVAETNEGKKEDVTEKSTEFDQYVTLIGLDKKELLATVGEEAEQVDEGGVEFKNAGIRVWFDQNSNSTVEQIFFMKSDIDMNGAKIGDTISSFKKIFGEPISDQNGDAHFKYKDVFISINYDTNTQETFGAYILKNDF